MVSTPGPSKAEDESRRVRTYKNTKGEGIRAVETFGWLMGGIAAGSRWSRRRDRPRPEDESRRARKYEKLPDEVPLACGHARHPHLEG